MYVKNKKIYYFIGSCNESLVQVNDVGIEYTIMQLANATCLNTQNRGDVSHDNSTYIVSYC